MFDRRVIYEGSVEVHYYFHNDQMTTEVLTRLVAGQEALNISMRDLLAQNTREEHRMTVQVDALIAEVNGLTEVVPGVVKLLDEIENRLGAIDTAEDAATQRAIDQVKDDIRNNKEAIAAAVAAHTPAAPADTGTPATPTGEVPGGGTVGGTTTPTGGEPGGTNLDPTPPSGEAGSGEGSGGSGTSGAGSGSGGSTGDGGPTP